MANIIYLVLKSPNSFDYIITLSKNNHYITMFCDALFCFFYHHAVMNYYYNYVIISFIAKICGEDGQVDPNCFVNAQSVVFTIMEQQ